MWKGQAFWVKICFASGICLGAALLVAGTGWVAFLSSGIGAICSVGLPLASLILSLNSIFKYRGAIEDLTNQVYLKTQALADLVQGQEVRLQKCEARLTSVELKLQSPAPAPALAPAPAPAPPTSSQPPTPSTPNPSQTETIAQQEKTIAELNRTIRELQKTTTKPKRARTFQAGAADPV